MLLARALRSGLAAGTSVRCSAGFSTLPEGGVALNTIKNMPGATKQKRRKGRGPGSGRGKTATRGQKGQKSRNNGGIAIGFEGGQTPLYKRAPKRGFKNIHAVPLEPLNLDKLEKYIVAGRIDGSKTITMKDIFDSGIVGNVRNGVKLLGIGEHEFSSKIDIEVSRASQSAIDAIEKCGGTITSMHYNRLGLRVLLKPHKFEWPLPRRARPPPRLQGFYTSYEKRGEYSKEMMEKRINRDTTTTQE